MTILGLDETEATALVRAVRPGEEERPAVAEAVARAAWSAISEPGDRDAGLLVAALGPVEAAARLIRRVPAATLRAELTEALTAVPAGPLTEHGPPSVAALEEALARWRPRVSAREVVRALGQAARFGVGLVLPGDVEWPAGLADLGAHAPHALWLRGSRELLAQAAGSLALVGSRAATGYGEHVAGELAAGTVARGLAVVSGGAYGIDGVAHRAALAAEGTTIAVLAGGLDRFYPAGHEELLARVVRSGAVVAEVPCGVAPTRWRFLQRNRIIAAMSRATIVVEAGWRSGALNTASHAESLGRPIGVVPGPVTSAASAGCHRLLRENPEAVLVTSAEEAVELASAGLRMEATVGGGLIGEAGPSGASRSASAGRNDAGSSGARSDDEPELVRLLDALSARSPREPEQLARLSGLAVDRVRARLGVLELEGRVRARSGAWLRVAARGGPARGGPG